MYTQHGKLRVDRWYDDRQRRPSHLLLRLLTLQDGGVVLSFVLFRCVAVRCLRFKTTTTGALPFFFCSSLCLTVFLREPNNRTMPSVMSLSCLMLGTFVAGSTTLAARVNMTVYHVNPSVYGPVPINEDTADLLGDMYFDLRSVGLPIECANPSALFH